MKILFIGATGMLGKPVAQELIRAGFDLQLLARDPEKTRALFPGARTIRGDVFDETGLQTAMTGVDIVYCNLSVQQNSGEKDLQPEREGVTNIINAAKKTGVRRIAYLSSLVHLYEGLNNFHWWAFRLKQDAVEKIKNSGIPYTIFYPSTFMECFPFQMMRGRTLGMVGRSREAMWLIAGTDYAKQVARSFGLLTTENREYIVQGPEPFTFEQANEIFIANYNRGKLKVIRAPIGVIKFFALFSRRLDYVWRICEALNKYPEKFGSGQTWKELGEPTVTFAEFTSSL